ncbi:MAG TPA: DNA-directed RNA polymerase subunit alpha C-terminal domain-containing protein [Paraburkholderia sp.]|uniref:DNA-directed RNA polymerase subunit alpha C-terminal domain-containing protein n=1 Tax=Paraburkholderia sp. TaxID=1926495 RepID=UPI002B4729F5|nr:DNA-directed RNA polymerase subunit alpha C-terminal domain-containing protein [Paraburkholderia sp.]HKR46523.1 DNA-directed RNA polymerase subunit alpha C-terminal domain-containing protein [Paraburkholderia sp.]
MKITSFDDANVATATLSEPTEHCNVAPGGDRAKELTIDDIGLTVRTSNNLRGAGILRIEQLLACSRDELSRIEGMGRTRLDDIESVLRELGLELQC